MVILYLILTKNIIVHQGIVTCGLDVAGCLYAVTQFTFVRNLKLLLLGRCIWSYTYVHKTLSACPDLALGITLGRRGN